MLDKQLRKEILATVAEATKDAQRELMEVYNEVWLTPAELCKQFGMFNDQWISRYGQLLPRAKAVVMNAKGDGKAIGTRFAYPKHKIARMIMEGKLSGLKMPQKSNV